MGRGSPSRSHSAGRQPVKPRVTFQLGANSAHEYEPYRGTSEPGTPVSTSAGPPSDLMQLATLPFHDQYVGRWAWTRGTVPSPTVHETYSVGLHVSVVVSCCLWFFFGRPRLALPQIRHPTPAQGG